MKYSYYIDKISNASWQQSNQRDSNAPKYALFKFRVQKLYGAKVSMIEKPKSPWEMGGRHSQKQYVHRLGCLFTHAIYLCHIANYYITKARKICSFVPIATIILKKTCVCRYYDNIYYGLSIDQYGATLLHILVKLLCKIQRCWLWVRQLFILNCKWRDLDTWSCYEHFQAFHRSFKTRLKNCLVWLAIAVRKGCQFKVHNHIVYV